MSRNRRQAKRRVAAQKRSHQQVWLRRYLRALSGGVTAASIGVGSLLGQTALGATDTWVGNSNANWATAANWSTNPLLPHTGDSLVFAAAGSAGTVLNDNLTTSPTYTLGTITFNPGAPSYTINAASGTRGFTFNVGGITNLSTNLQNFNDNITINTSATETLTAGGGNLSLGGIISGPGSLITAGTGTLTLSGNNSFAGGVTVASGDSLDINSTTAVGTGALTFLGAAVLDNTSAAAITLTNNNAVNINGDFTFVGTQDLDFGTGTVTLGGGAGQRTLTVNGSSTLTTGVINSVVASGSGMIKAGTGTWTIAPIAGNLPTQTSTVEGTLTVSAGRVNIGQDDAFFGGLAGSGIVANGSNTTRWLTVGSDNANTTFSGSLIDGGSGHLGLRKRGAGTLTLTSSNTLSDQITVEGGTLDVSSTGSILPASSGSNLVVGDTATPAIFRLDGGTVQVQTVALGQGAGVNGNNTDNRSGAFYQTGGTLQLLNEASVNNFRIGDGANGATAGNGGYGYYGLSGGTANLAEFAVGGGNNGGSGNIGVMDMTGGTINDQGWVTIARGANSTGIMNLIGPSANNPNNPVINFTQGGGGQILYSTFGDSKFYGVVTISNATMQTPVGANVPLNLANTTNGTGGALGVMNLGPGGLLRIGNVQAANNIALSGGATYLNFTGGTLQASVTNTAFMAGTAANNITGVVVYSGGGTIDNNSFNITIGHPMVAPDSSGATTGITNIAIDAPGSGYIGAPAVVLSGAGATDATARAVMVDDGSGNGTFKIDHIEMTCIGIGNGTMPTVTLVGGGTATPGTVGQNLSDFTFVSNVGTGGGMTFKGSGITTLSGANTYTGDSTVSGGTLMLFTGGSLTSNVNINGTGAKFVQSNTSTAFGQTVTVTNGTLDGIGTLNNVVVPNGGGTVSNGATGAATGTVAASATGITVGTLTYNGTGTWAPVTSDANAAAGTPSLNVTTLTLNGAPGSVAVSPINIAGTFTNNTYTLAKYTTLNGTTGFAALTPNVVGLGGRQTETLTNNTGNSTITLTIGGSYLNWTGSGSSNWQLGGPSDWNLSQGLTATTYQSTSGIQDAVVFDDSAGAGSKTVSISNGNVAPPRVTFNNTSAGGAYTINGPNAITGSGSIFINNTGAVTLNTANTFSGGVTVSNSLGGTNASGTLNIGNNTAIGSGTLTLGLKATIDAVGADRVLTNNNVEIWNGDINFTGSNNLNLGTGAVKINVNSNNTAENATTGTVVNGVATASTVNVVAKTLTIGGPISGPGVSLVKQGAGTLVLNGPATYSQQTVIHNGELQTSGGLGTISQNIQISPLGSAGDSGTFTVLGGTVNANIIDIAGSTVGLQYAGSGTMNINAGTVNVGGTTNSLIVGAGGPAGTQSTHPATGTLNMNGGTLNVNFQGVSALGDLEVGRSAGMTGIVNQYNGAINILNTQDPNSADTSGLNMLANGAAAATYNMNGGTLTIYNNAGVMPGGGGIRMGVAGNGVATFNLNGGTVQTQFVNKEASGVTATFNFNGGTLKAAQNNLNTANVVGGGPAPPVANDNNGGGTGFMSDLTAANVLGGGAIFDNNGVQMGISQSLLHGTAGPATDGGLTAKGIGTLALSGTNTYNGGTFLNAGTLAIDSASAIGTGALTINGTGTTVDNITGGAITLTSNNSQNWNNDFSFGGTSSLNMGTGAVTMNATRTITTNLVNAGATLTVGGVISGSGFGLIKAGPGNLALSGASNYTGPTTVKGGTLSLTGSGAINSSNGITVSGGRLLQSSSTALTPTVTLANGTVDGTTTINTVNVANTLAATVTHGNGTVAPVAIGTLNFGGSATVNILTSDATALTAKIATTNLLANAAGNVVINAANTANVWSSGTTYELFSYSGSIGGAGFSKFAVGQFAGLGAHQTVTLTNPAGFIDAVIGGDTLVWTGALDGTWTSATQSAPHNWKLSSTGAQTDFFTSDAVSFSDGASTGTVNLTANVSAASVQFTNSALPYTLGSTSGFGLVQGAISISGGGSLTIANTNSYAGGTTLSNGTLNLQSAGALGTGTLTISGGTVNNTLGSPLTLANNIPQTWSGNFTFTGSSDLNMGTGAVTLGGSGTSRTVNVANGDLTVGPISGALGLTLSGPGTLTIDSSSVANGAQSNITGEINITGGGKLQIGSPNSPTNSASDFNAGGLTGNGIVENGSTGNPAGTNIVERWLLLNNSANDVFSGVLQDGAGGVNGRLGLSKSGAGDLTLSGANTLSGAITVAGGQLILTGSINSNNDSGTANGQVNVGTNAIGQNGILSIQNGTMVVPKNVAPGVQVGGGPNTAGVLKISGNSASLNTTSELWLGTADSGYGAMDILGGTVNVGSWFAIARGGGVGILNMSGGALNLTSNNLTIGSVGGATGDGIAHGQVNLTGGIITTNFVTNVFVGEQSNGVLNVSGTGQLAVGGSEGVAFARGNADAFGIMNLGTGGVVQTTTVHPGQVITGANVGGTGTLNFHGGTLVATSNDVDTTGFNFIPANGTGYAGTLNLYSYKEGAVIDDGGNSISVDLPIQAPTGNGVSATGLSVSGSGFVDTPAVQITGGGGTGATANAIIDSNGNLTGIVITNPGTDYTSAPTFTLVGGGVTNTGHISGTATLAANVSGGLTKLGNGTLNLTANNTYTGPTKVVAGTLHFNLSDAVSSASSLQMAGGTLNTGGFNQSMGALKVISSSTIDMSSPQAVQEIFNFANSRNSHWTNNSAMTPAILNITNWSNATSDQIIFPTPNALNANQLNQIEFNGSGYAKLVSVTGGFELEPSATQATGALLYGDINQDGHVNAKDIAALEAALVNLPGYLNGTVGRSTGGIWDNSQSIYVADINYDDQINNSDLQALLNLLKGGGGSNLGVPEPETFVLLIMGAIPGIWLLRNRIRRRGTSTVEELCGESDDATNVG